MGIGLTVISMIVMITYLMRYHGTIFEEFMQNKQIESKSRFAKLKGSLGFAFGSLITKLAAPEEGKSKENSKNKITELKIER